MVYLHPTLAEMFPPEALDELEAFLQKHVVATSHEMAAVEIANIVHAALTKQMKEIKAQLLTPVAA